MRPDRATLVGIALLCFANLLLSVVITRLFSATMFYHFTFMAVGLAMFGIAASGVFVFLRSAQFEADLQGNLARYARWFGIRAIEVRLRACRWMSAWETCSSRRLCAGRRKAAKWCFMLPRTSRTGARRRTISSRRR